MTTSDERPNRPESAFWPRIPHAARRTATFAVFLAATSLGACSSAGSSDYSQIVEFAKQAWTGNGQDITLQQAAAVPYASIGVRIGDGPQQMLILATDSGGDRLWTSASHIVLALRAGRIVRTVGLGHDLSGLRRMKSGTLEPPRTSLKGPVQQTLLADFGDLGVYSTPIVCTAQPTGAEPIDILGQNIKTERVDEGCNDANLGWTFVNTYWVDPATGLVWRSVQYIHPDADTVEIDVLRPPGK